MTLVVIGDGQKAGFRGWAQLASHWARVFAFIICYSLVDLGETWPRSYYPFYPMNSHFMIQMQLEAGDFRQVW